MESLQLTASELNIPLLLVDTDSFLFNPLIFQIHSVFQHLLSFSSNFLIFLGDVLETLNMKQNFFPGDTLMGYFSGVQTTPKPHWFAGRLWTGEFQLFLYGQRADTHSISQKQCRASGVEWQPRGWANRAEMWLQARLEARAGNSMNAFHTRHYW